MTASTRRFRPSLLRRANGRPNAGVAAVAALALGLAACGDDATEDDDTPELEEPADDVEADDGADPDADPEATEPEGEAAPPEDDPAAFEDLEDGEVVPGVRLDAPIDEEASQAQRTPTGSAFIASLEGETGALTVNVEFEGQELDEMLAGIEALVEAGQAEVTEEAEDVEVEGADEAQRVELSAPEGGATAIGIFARADGNSISLAVEVLEDADIDVEAIIDSIEIDPERLQAEGTLDIGEGELDGGAADGTDMEADPEADPEGDDGDVATDPDEDE
jgi:hypothetical protein